MFVLIFVGCPQKYFNMKIFQLHIIEITVHVLLIMTSYLAIATFLHVLQRYLCKCNQTTYSLHTAPSKIHSSVTRALQRQCYPGIAIVDKDSHESCSQLIKPCSSLSSHACQWLQLSMRMTALYN